MWGSHGAHKAEKAICPAILSWVLFFAIYCDVFFRSAPGVPHGRKMVPAAGFEPATFGLQNHCTTTVLCRLSAIFRHSDDSKCRRKKVHSNLPHFGLQNRCTTPVLSRHDGGILYRFGGGGAISQSTECREEVRNIKDLTDFGNGTGVKTGFSYIYLIDSMARPGVSRAGLFRPAFPMDRFVSIA